MSLFLRINNRDNFLIKNFPVIHPKSIHYKTFWREQKRRVIEGFWSIDDSEVSIDVASKVNPSEYKSDKWRYMPSNLYFYVNIGSIAHRPKGMPKTSPKIIIRPYLRDLEWEFFYNWAECRGFSGFMDDEEYSCNNLLKLEEITDEELMQESFDINGEIVDTIYNNFFNKEGKRKKYIEPKIGLRKLYNKPMGLALFNNEAKNLLVLGARGGGKSYIAAVGVSLHEVITNGTKYYTQDSIDNPPRAEVFVGAALSSKSRDMLEKTQSAMNNLTGIWKKGESDEIQNPLYKQMKGQLLKSGNKWEHIYEKKINGKWQDVGTKSYIKHGTFTVENPEAAAGGRYSVIVVEEVGLLPNSLVVSGSNEATQMTDGTVKYGSSLYLGTGGNVDKIVETEILFRDPEGFNFLSFDDEFENSGKIGFFIPATHMDGNFKDDNGNTLEDEAMAHYIKRREKKRKAASSSALEMEKYNYPLKPSEMFLSPASNNFPLTDVKHRLSELMSNADLLNASDKGFYVISEGGNIVFKNEADATPLRQFPISKADARKMDLTGCVEVFEHPISDDGGKVPHGRYIASLDPVDDDGNEVSGDMLSLQSFFILDTYTKRIVLEYTGRTRLAKDFYEQVRRALIAYNGVLLYENQKKGLFPHFDSKSSLYLLADTPQMLRDVDLQRGSTVGNKSKGMYATTKLISLGIDLLLTYIDEQAPNKEDGVKILSTIRSVGILLEMIKYNGKINTDRISSLIILMIYLKSIEKVIINKKQNIKTLADDPMWDLIN